MKIIIMALGLIISSLSFAQDKRPMTANEVLNSLQQNVLKTLLDGNTRYRDQVMKTCFERTTKEIRTELAKGQKPYAIILSCSDSRVPPELIFDQGPGDIFVIRVAGNVVDPIVLGSIEYAAEHLGSPLIMVLGHERCGAVTATVKSHGPIEGHVSAIVKAIHPAVAEAKKKADGINADQLVENAIDENVHLVAKNIYNESEIIRHLVDTQKIKIVEAKFDLDDGKVSLFPEQKFVKVEEEKPAPKKIVIRKKMTEVEEVKAPVKKEEAAAHH